MMFAGRPARPAPRGWDVPSQTLQGRLVAVIIVGGLCRLRSVLEWWLVGSVSGFSAGYLFLYSFAQLFSHHCSLVQEASCVVRACSFDCATPLL
jgi:hypothetical protein